jgi:hypothetical protein
VRVSSMRVKPPVELQLLASWGEVTDIGIATGVRAKAARRTAEGKFTKIIFNQIGGKECRRFAAMTWKERDAFMAKPENAVVRNRYEKHMASVGAK